MGETWIPIPLKVNSMIPGQLDYLSVSTYLVFFVSQGQDSEVAVYYDKSIRCPYVLADLNEDLPKRLICQ